MNGQMKTLIDRTVPRYEEIRNKDFYFIVAAADTSTANMQKTIQGFKGFTEDCLDGAREKGIIYGTGAWQIGDIKNSPAMNEAYEMGKMHKGLSSISQNKTAVQAGQQPDFPAAV